MPDPGSTSGPAQDRAGTKAARDERGLIDASTELVDVAVKYARQEAGDLVREKIVEPTQRAGVTAGLAVAIGLIAALGLAFVSVGVLLVLANAVGWPVALFIIGGVLLIGAAVVAFMRSKKVSR